MDWFFFSFFVLFRLGVFINTTENGCNNMLKKDCLEMFVQRRYGSLSLDIMVKHTITCVTNLLELQVILLFFKWTNMFLHWCPSSAMRGPQLKLVMPGSEPEVGACEPEVMPRWVLPSSISISGMLSVDARDQRKKERGEGGSAREAVLCDMGWKNDWSFSLSLLSLSVLFLFK